MSVRFGHVLVTLVMSTLAIVPIGRVALSADGDVGQTKGGGGGTPGFSGTVKSLTNNSLTIAAGGKEMTFAVDASTKVVAKGAGSKSAEKGGKAPIADLVAVGDKVTVKYLQSAGANRAVSVTVTAKTMKR
jgi:hypothetical protein